MKIMNETIEQIKAYLNSKKSLVLQKEEVLSKIDINRFNIFTSISSVYFKEKFHSDILANILDPETDTIGNSKYFSLFLELLFAENNHSRFTSDFSKIIVSKEEAIIGKASEEGFIDIFISDPDKSKCIIIENKINKAADMKNQLARYVEYAKNEGFNEIVIVYIPLYEKMPPLEYYDEKYNEYTALIKKNIIVLDAKKLAEKFIDECINITSLDNRDAYVYLVHYSRLLKYLGEEAMAKEQDVKILEQIYDDPLNITIARNISDVWTNRTALIGEIIAEELIKKDGKLLTKSSFSDNTALIFTINELYLGIRIKKEDKNKLGTNITNQLEHSLGEDFSLINEGNKGLEPWVYDRDNIIYFKRFLLENYAGSINDLKNKFVKLAEELVI